MGMQQPAKKVPPGPALTRLGGAPDLLAAPLAVEGNLVDEDQEHDRLLNLGPEALQRDHLEVVHVVERVVAVPSQQERLHMTNKGGRALARAL